MNGSTWNENIVCIRDQITTGSYRVLELQQPYGAIAQTPGWSTNFAVSNGKSHTIYNAFEFMNGAGQFYFNKTTHILYYWPKAGEDMSTADVEAPVLDKLIDLEGNSTTDRISNITFQGITFANTDWQLEQVGNSHGKATVQGATAFNAYGDGNWHNSKYEILDTNPGMINANSADSINFYDDVVKHSGADGISMVNDAINCNIIGNYIYDIASSGISVGNPQHVYIGDGTASNHEKYAPGVEGICKNDTIQNNMMYNISTAPGFGGCAGVTAFFVDTLNITYNTIDTTAYNGINLGWGWMNFPDSTTCRNNTVSYNRLYNTLNRLHDSGAIYTLGQMPDTNINENYVKGIPNNAAGPTYGLHNDEGSAYITENDNVLDIDPGVTYTINSELYNNKHDLTILRTYATVYKMGATPPTSTIDVPVVVPDNVWPMAQYNILLEAGIQEAYRSLLPASLYPVQDYVFPASCSTSLAMTSINIRSSGNASNEVWFAPAGTTSFTAGPTMTKAAGTATSIAVPRTAGTYRLFVKDSLGNVSQSASLLRVSASAGNEPAPQAADFTTGSALGSNWSIKNEDNTKYSFVPGSGLSITTQAGDLLDDSVKNLFLQQAGGDWVAQTKVTLSAAETTSPQSVGFVLYGDSQNYLKLVYERGSSSSAYGFYNTINGTKTTIGKTVTLNNQLTHYFRLVKKDTTYSAYYSTDGYTYNMIGSTVSLVSPKIGLLACNGSGSLAPSINATFENLKIGTLDDINADATLSEIKLDGSSLSGFSPTNLNYTVSVPIATAALQVATCTPADPKATVSIANASSLPGTTTITVTNGFNTKKYSISFGFTQKYEAELATLSGGASIATDHTGYSGNGFVAGLYNKANAKVSFSVNAPLAGKYALAVGYSMGSGGTSTNISLTVNGSKIKNISCPSTSSSWDKWAETKENITLNSGVNTITFNTETASTTCINMDYITLAPLTPSWPQNSTLTASNVTDTGLTLTWTAANDDTAVTAYRIYKGTDLLVTSTGNALTYVLTGITPVGCTFKVEAGDEDGNWSTDGPSMTAETAAPTWPQGSALAASDMTEDSVTLTWTPAQDSDKVIGYRIYEGAKLLATSTGNALTYVLNGITPVGSTFKVEAGNASGNWSTDGPWLIAEKTAPAWPQGSTLTASEISASGVTLTWTAAQDNTAVTGYKIYKGTELLVTTTGNALTYVLTGIAPDGCTFKVEAGDASGNWSTDGPIAVVNVTNGGTGVEPETITAIDPVSAATVVGTAPVLPATVTVKYSDNSTAQKDVVWDDIASSQYAQAGTFDVQGTVTGTAIKAVAHVIVSARTETETGDNHTGDNNTGDNNTGDNNTGTPAAPAESPVVGDNGKVNVPVSAPNAQGQVNAEIDASTVNKALEKAIADANGVKTITVNVPAVNGATEYKQTLPASVLSAGNKNTKVSIETEIGKIELPSNMLGSTAVQDSKVAISLSKSDTKGLDAKLIQEIGNKPVIELNLYAGDKKISWNNSEAPVKITFKYTPASNEEIRNSEFITVWYIDGEGKAVSVPNARYDAATGEVTFTTTHFSRYAVAYAPKTFADLDSSAWARHEIEVMASKGIISGVSSTMYNPSANIKRADFLKLLITTLDLNADFTDNFEDVSKNAYYYKTVGIARKLGIVNGIGNGKFEPEKDITRQELMVMTARALKAAQKQIEAGAANQLASFADAADVSGYAQTSVSALIKSGIIKGSNGRINPLDNTTRAEAAVIMYRLYNK